MAEKLLIPGEVQNFIPGKSPKVLATERCLRRDTPPFIRIGKKIYYSESALLAWIEEHKVNPATSVIAAKQHVTREGLNPRPCRANGAKATKAR